MKFVILFPLFLRRSALWFCRPSQERPAETTALMFQPCTDCRSRDTEICSAPSLRARSSLSKFLTVPCVHGSRCPAPRRCWVADGSCLQRDKQGWISYPVCRATRVPIGLQDRASVPAQMVYEPLSTIAPSPALDPSARPAACLSHAVRHRLHQHSASRSSPAGRRGAAT